MRNLLHLHLLLIAALVFALKARVYTCSSRFGCLFWYIATICLLTAIQHGLVNLEKSVTEGKIFQASPLSDEVNKTLFRKDRYLHRHGLAIFAAGGDIAPILQLMTGNDVVCSTADGARYSSTLLHDKSLQLVTGDVEKFASDGKLLIGQFPRTNIVWPLLFRFTILEAGLVPWVTFLARRRDG